MAKNDKPEKNEKKQKHFWKDFKAELKKVIWPTRSQVVNNTVIVLVIVAIVTALCFVLDFVFETINTYGINRLKTVVQSSSNTIDNTIDNTIVDDSTIIEDEADIELEDNLDNGEAE